METEVEKLVDTLVIYINDNVLQQSTKPHWHTSVYCSSRLISEAKQGRASLILGWESSVYCSRDQDDLLGALLILVWFSHMSTIWLTIHSFKLTLVKMMRAILFCSHISHLSVGYPRHVLMTIEEKRWHTQWCNHFQDSCFMYPNIPKEGIWINPEPQ